MRLVLLMVTFLATPCLAGPSGVKSVFLNGVDISSARSQELKNVDVIINEQGDIFLLAPHYQVNEEDTYVPLSKYAQGLGPISHKPPKAVRSPIKKDDGQDGRGREKTNGEKPAKGDTAQNMLPPVQDTAEAVGSTEGKGAASEGQSAVASPGVDSEATAKPKDKNGEKTDDSGADGGEPTP